MMHLAISCFSYLLFFMVRALTPTAQASWRINEQTALQRTTQR
ncbi:MAG TPA: hypothetical protein VKR52_21655 [Terracidiphilus sp.]|nr:hypothetical protein [Terracidiphilus sp.]